jgi:hypothetical protein
LSALFVYSGVRQPVSTMRSSIYRVQYMNDQNAYLRMRRFFLELFKIDDGPLTADSGGLRSFISMSERTRSSAARNG